MDFKRSAKTADDLRHAFCANDCAYPTPLEPELYDRAKREGFEMVGYYVRLPRNGRLGLGENGGVTVDDSDKIEVTIWDAEGKIVVHEFCPAFTASDEDIFQMVRLIDEGLSARDAVAAVQIINHTDHPVRI